MASNTPDSPSTPIQAGFWACSNIAGCCYNNNGSTMDPPHWVNATPNKLGGKPAGANLAINFTGMTGINQVGADVPPFGEVTSAEVPACAGMDHCWLNLGGGFGGDPAVDHPVTLDGFKSLIANAKKIKDLGYTGVVFDYESDDPHTTLTFKDWKRAHRALSRAGLDSALCMAQAGMGFGTKFGFGCTPAPGTSKCNIAKEIPFTYNLPQLYGGWPLFYTGEYNDQWAAQKFTGYNPGRPPCTAKPSAARAASATEPDSSCARPCTPAPSCCPPLAASPRARNSLMASMRTARAGGMTTSPL